MCTRYYIDHTIPELEEIADIAVQTSLASRFIHTHGRPVITDGKVHPTDIVPVIAPNPKGVRSVYPMQWGFIAKDGKRTLFNARMETAGQKPTFKEAWKSHRCIVPAAYYYEWQHFKSPDGKQRTGDKFAIQPKGCTVTWLCGLYRIEDGYPVFVILTKDPTADLELIHDRMPLILPEEQIDAWINPSTKPEDVIPYALSDMILERAE